MTDFRTVRPSASAAGVVTTKPLAATAVLMAAAAARAAAPSVPAGSRNDMINAAKVGSNRRSSPSIVYTLFPSQLMCTVVARPETAENSVSAVLLYEAFWSSFIIR